MTVPHTPVETGLPVTDASKRVRRPATGAEQKRRREWGRFWGGEHSAFWKAQHTKEANQ